MTEVERTELPGIGVRADLTCTDGTHLGVIVHRQGRRDVLVFTAEEPDEPRISVSLDEDDARTLSELLGGPRVTESATEALELEGLVIDWIRIPAGAPLVGRTLAESQIHSQTGASVVAVVREHGTVVAPGANDRLDAGDTAVVVGDDKAIAAFMASLRA